MGKPITELEIQDIVPKTPVGWVGSCCCCTWTIILVVLFFPCTVIQLGQFKVGLTRSKTTGIVNLDDTYTPGRYWIGFWKEFIEFPTTLQTISFSDEAVETGVQALGKLRTRDMDGKEVYLDITVQYRVHPQQIGEIYQMFTNVYEDVYISELRDAMAKTCNQFAIHEVWENYETVLALMKAACDAALEARHADCWGLQLYGISLNAAYESQIIKTQVSKQAKHTEQQTKVHTVYRAKTDVILAEYDKNITIIQANGQNQKIKLVGDASAAAEANLIAAQADKLNIWRSTVAATRSNGQSVQMNDTQLLMYQKYNMIGHMPTSNWVYSHKSESSGIEAVNVQAARAMTGGAEL